MLDRINNYLEAGYEVAGYEIQTILLISIVGIMAATWIINRISDILIKRSIEEKGGNPHAIATSKRLSAYIIYTIGAIAILGVLGVPFTALGTVVGLLGLGISFALRDMIANFISGLLILIQRPFKIGDQIKVEGEEGTVQDIKIRATSVRTYDGREVIVPNSKLYSGVVTNNTSYDQRRFDVIVGISYDDNIGEAKEAAIEALDEAETVESEPDPQVLISELGGSSVDLKLRGWTKPSRASVVKASSEVTQLVKEKYDEKGIDIPYPIRTVYMNESE